MGALTAALVALLLGPTAALADRAFAPRFTTTDRGQVVMAANTAMSCPTSASGCAAAHAGTSSDDNGSFAMGYTDVDSDSTTFNSSRSTLALPSASTVLFAGLYWGGDTSAGDNGDDAPLPAARVFVRFQTPAASTHHMITASVLDTDATSSTATRRSPTSRASSRRRATAPTPSAPSKRAPASTATAAGASSCTGTRPSRPAASSCTTGSSRCSPAFGRRPASRSPGSSRRRRARSVLGRLAMLSWEGDRGITGDSATFAGRSLSDAANPVTNLFNSSVSRAGVATTGRTPSYTNLLGVDAQELTIDGSLANGASSATLHFATGTDLYLTGAIGLAFDEGPPRSTSAPTVSGTARDGQTLTAGPGV